MALCYDGALDSAKCSGKIIVCDRGGIALFDKVVAVYNIGGEGIVIASVPGGLTAQVALSTFPSVLVTAEDGQRIKSYIQSSAS